MYIIDLRTCPSYAHKNNGEICTVSLNMNIHETVISKLFMDVIIKGREVNIYNTF